MYRSIFYNKREDTTRLCCVVCVVCVSESARQVAAVYKVLHGESDYCEIDTRVRKIKNEKENLAVFTFPRKTHTLFFLHLCVERLTCIKTKLQHTHTHTLTPMGGRCQMDTGQGQVVMLGDFSFLLHCEPSSLFPPFNLSLCCHAAVSTTTTTHIHI